MQKINPETKKLLKLKSQLKQLYGNNMRLTTFLGQDDLIINCRPTEF